MASNERKPGGVGQFLREATSEMRKVVWPSREETQRLTLVVIAISLSIGALLAVFDLLFTQVVQFIITIGDQTAKLYVFDYLFIQVMQFLQ